VTWYRFFQLLLGLLVRATAKLHVVGLENLPRRGPFIVVANHQSILDPIVVQVVCPRPLHTLTKSSQFSGALMGWVLPRVNAIPTRRYRVDPQVIRVMLRRLAAEEAVGIYPEGERSWDGDLQPFRRGTIRFLLKAGVPVVPCGVAGTYDVWPRWSHRLRRGKVRVEFGRPLQWPAMDRREERERALEGAMRDIAEALESLSAWDSVRAEGDGGGRGVGEALPEKLPAWLQPAVVPDGPDSQRS
jgi:1-acyl-sn-glycerol-3-phosphate acyltransferase